MESKAFVVRRPYETGVSAQDFREWERIRHVKDQDYADVVFWDKLYSDFSVRGKDFSFDWYLSAEDGE